MTLTIQAEIAPIILSEDGTARVADTRVTLDTIVAAFHNGDSPEQITDNFSVLSLADVYAVIAYYLRNRSEVDDYLAKRSKDAQRLHTELQDNASQMFTLRQRLLKHKQSNR